MDRCLRFTGEPIGCFGYVDGGWWIVRVCVSLRFQCEVRGECPRWENRVPRSRGQIDGGSLVCFSQSRHVVFVKGAAAYILDLQYSPESEISGKSSTDPITRMSFFFSSGQDF